MRTSKHKGPTLLHLNEGAPPKLDYMGQWTGGLSQNPFCQIPELWKALREKRERICSSFIAHFQFSPIIVDVRRECQNHSSATGQTTRDILSIIDAFQPSWYIIIQLTFIPNLVWAIIFFVFYFKISRRVKQFVEGLIVSQRGRAHLNPVDGYLLPVNY